MGPIALGGDIQGLLVREPSDGSWMRSNLEAGGQPLYSINWIRVSRRE